MVLPFLVKLLGALLVGAAGFSMFQHPEVAKSAQPSVGIVLVEHAPGAPTSGTVFVAGDHLLMTAAHVVQKASHIMARFKDTEWLEAKVIESDPINDVAVLSYEGPDIPPLPLADFEKVKPGEYVAVLAFPSIEDLVKQEKGPDLQEKAAKALTGAEGTVRSIRGTLLVIGTADVPWNGGPVLNLKGEVIGVVRGKFDVDVPGLVSYAAPSNIVKPVLTAAERKRPAEPAPATAAQAPQGGSPGAPQTAAPAASQTTAPDPSQPAAQAPSQPAGQAPSQPPTAGTPPASQPPSPSPSPTPAQPVMAAASQPPPSPPASATVAPFLIVPGQSVGPVRLGSPLREELVGLGPTKGTAQLEDGTTMYRWFEPPNNAGIGLRTSQNGTVLRVWVLNDARYSTKEGLHVGSTEAEIRTALGVPTRVEFSSQGKTRTLIYESLGLWFSIQLDPQYNFYNTVFDIGVMTKK